MKICFNGQALPWVRYSKYEYKQARNGQIYIVPAANAKPEVYNPLKNSEQIVLDALNTGRLAMGRKMRKPSENPLWTS